jgi:CBS domain-containing protein
MRDLRVGSLLVMAGVEPPRLVGIFTERDLLRRIEEIHRGEYWEKPVALLMSKPVKTLSILELDRAPELMLKHGIRHVPIVYTDADDREHIAGVISARDVLAALWRSRGEAGVVESPRSPPRIGLVSRDPLAKRILVPLLEQRGRSQVLQLEPDSFDNAPPAVSLVVLDLDRFGQEEWTRVLQGAIRWSRRSAPAGQSLGGILLLFDPALHAPRTAELIRKLGKSESIAVFAKPLNVIELFQRMAAEIANSPQSRKPADRIQSSS